MIPPSIPPSNEAKSPGEESQAWQQAGRCKALHSLRTTGEGRNQKGKRRRGERGAGAEQSCRTQHRRARAGRERRRNPWGS